MWGGNFPFFQNAIGNEEKIVLKQKKFLIGGLIVLLAIGFLGYKSFAGAAMYYFTVNETIEKGPSIYGSSIKVEGLIEEGSVEREPASRLLKFVIADIGGVNKIPVVYQGVVPDTFKEGLPIVVEGALGSDGIFLAQILMVKCPSKYEPAQ